MMRTKRKRTIFIAIIIILMVGVWQFTGDSGEEDFFTEMVLNAQHDMESVDQDNPQTTELLSKYIPRIFVDRESYFPIDFYNEYVPNTHLYESGRFDKLLDEDVTADDLKDLMYQSKYYLDYQVDRKDLLGVYGEAYETSIYGRIYRSDLRTDGGKTSLLFLKYSLVFPYSGLPSATSDWKLAGSNIIGDPLAWHELDIHGAIHIVLEEQTMKPVGVILAQHNHHRVYLVNEDFKWPRDNRLAIAFAKFSNEPYLADLSGSGRTERTVGNPMEMDFLLGFTDSEPLTAGYDYIPSIESEAVEVKTSLVQLSPDDPLYRATMGLGDRKKILGLFRTFYLDGPPGIDFYTLPDMLDLAELMAFWDIDISDEDYRIIYEESELTFGNFDISKLQMYQRPKLKEKIDNIIKK